MSDQMFNTNHSLDQIFTSSVGVAILIFLYGCQLFARLFAGCMKDTTVAVLS